MLSQERGNPNIYNIPFESMPRGHMEDEDDDSDMGDMEGLPLSQQSGEWEEGDMPPGEGPEDVQREMGRDMPREMAGRMSGEMSRRLPPGEMHEEMSGEMKREMAPAFPHDDDSSSSSLPPDMSRGELEKMDMAEEEREDEQEEVDDGKYPIPDDGYERPKDTS